MTGPFPFRPPKPPCRLDTLIKDDIAEAFLNSIRTAGRGIILVVGRTAAGKTVLATSIAGELSAEKHRVFCITDAPAPDRRGYGDANWCNVTTHAAHPLTMAQDDILLLDQPVPDWSIAHAFGCNTVVVTMDDHPDLWRLVKLAGLPFIKTVHIVNERQRLRRTVSIYNGLVDPNDLPNTVLSVQDEHFLEEQELIPLPANVSTASLKDAIRTWVNCDLAAAARVFTDAQRKGY